MRHGTRWLAALTLCVLLAGAGELQAQTRADSAAILLNAAEQLRLRGEADAARALLELIARQYAGTPAAAEVDRMHAVLLRMPEAERSGRTELLVFGAGYGAWLGVAVPLALDSEKPEAYGIGLLLGAPLGFYAAKQYADAKMPTRGQTRALSFGGMWGSYQGFALAELLDLGTDTGGTGSEATAHVTAAVAGGLLGIGTGAFLARKPITAGTAAAVTLGGMWATWFGFGLAFMADQEGDELLAATMIGGNAGLIAFGFIAPRWRMSENRARLIDLGGLVGGLAGAGLLLIAQPDDANTAILLPLAGSAAGLALASLWTRDRVADATPDGRGALINRSSGTWAFDVPDASLRLPRSTQDALRTAVYVPLVRAHF